MFKKPLTKKIFVTCCIALILLIPLMLIEDKIDEREFYQNQAKNSIAKSWTGAQTIIGPIIVLPYTLRWTENIYNNKKNTTKTKTREATRHVYILPSDLTANLSVQSSQRYKGIFQVPVYETAIEWQTQFNAKTLEQQINKAKKSNHFSHFKKPFVALSVSDPRGISQIPKLTAPNQSLSFEPGTQGHLNNIGAHAIIENLDVEHPKELNFSISLQLRGMERISIVPAAQNAKLNMRSDWPHPSFGGDQLPQTRSIQESGFTAHWKTTSFSNPWEELLESCSKKGCAELISKSVYVDLIEPVDIYLQSERSIKYGFLFISLSFLAFFIFEILQRHPIHPIQYTLIGLSLAVFYLLLIALSEHMDFKMAYGIASLACIGLLATYIRFVLSKLKHSIRFSGCLALLYGILYVVIQAEDFALLMGSFLVFTALGIVMWVTRQIDWYQIESQVLQQGEPQRLDHEEDLEKFENLQTQ